MMDDELAARFELLKLELDHIESSVRAFDTILFQVKGWCVTLVVATAGIAVTTNRPSILVIALGALGGFWLLDGLYKSQQRMVIDRRVFVETALGEGSVAEALSTKKLRVPALAETFRSTSLGYKSKDRWIGYLKELARPLTFGMYLMLAVLVLILGTAMSRIYQ